jgi:signal peptidase I
MADRTTKAPRGRRANRMGGAARLAIGLWGAIAAGLVFFGAAFTPYRVEGPSMTPTYADGDWVWMWRAAYGLRAGGSYVIRWSYPRAGQAVAARNPLDGRLVVKRCAAVEGSPLSVASGRLSIAGRDLPVSSDQAFHLLGMSRVPPGTVFLLGDNPAQSQDSREYGPLPVAAIVGMVIGSIHRR